MINWRVIIICDLLFPRFSGLALMCVLLCRILSWFGGDKRGVIYMGMGMGELGKKDGPFR
jgi:hypothetical protein